MWDIIPSWLERDLSITANFSDILFLIILLAGGATALWRRREIFNRISRHTVVGSINYLTGERGNHRLNFDTIVSGAMGTIFVDPHVREALERYVVRCKKTTLVDLGGALQHEAMASIENAVSARFAEKHLKASKGNGDDRAWASIAMVIEIPEEWLLDRKLWKKLKIFAIWDGQEHIFGDDTLIAELKVQEDLVDIEFHRDRLDPLNLFAEAIQALGGKPDQTRVIGRVRLPTK